MTIDQGDHAHLAYLIRREKETEERLENARQEVLLWVKRGKLASKAKRPDMIQQAKERALAAKHEFDQASTELRSIQGEKANLHRTRSAPDADSTIRAEVMVEEFRMRGFDPDEQEANEVSERMEAELQLLSLKGQKNGSRELTPSQDRLAEAVRQEEEAETLAEPIPNEPPPSAETAPTAAPVDPDQAPVEPLSESEPDADSVSDAEVLEWLAMMQDEDVIPANPQLPEDAERASMAASMLAVEKARQAATGEDEEES